MRKIKKDMRKIKNEIRILQIQLLTNKKNKDIEI